jgi:hypothetical protein
MDLMQSNSGMFPFRSHESLGAYIGILAISQDHKKFMMKFAAVAAAGLVVFGTFVSYSAGGEPLRAEPVHVITSGESDRGAKQPQAAVDPHGRIYVVFGQGNHIRCATSTDEGKSFKSTAVGTVGSLALGMRRGPRIAANSEVLVVTAIGGKEGKGRDGDVLAWRSADSGGTWTGPTRMNAVAGSAREGLHSMAAGPNGLVYCAWLDLRNNRTEIYGVRSKDGGLTWEKDTLVYRSPEKSVCECCHPSVAFAPDGTLYVMWRNQLAGARDMFLVRSTSGGESFGEAEKLGRETWPLNACPMDGGAIAAGANGQVDTVWMRAGAIYAARPGEKERELGRGVQGWTAFGSDGEYSVWLDKRPGKLLAIVPGGKMPTILAESANDPVIAAALSGGGPVVAVWESKSEEGGLFSYVLSPRANVSSR